MITVFLGLQEQFFPLNAFKKNILLCVTFVQYTSHYIQSEMFNHQKCLTLGHFHFFSKTSDYYMLLFLTGTNIIQNTGRTNIKLWKVVNQRAIRKSTSNKMPLILFAICKYNAFASDQTFQKRTTNCLRFFQREMQDRNIVNI